MGVSEMRLPMGMCSLPRSLSLIAQAKRLPGYLDYLDDASIQKRLEFEKGDRVRINCKEDKYKHNGCYGTIQRKIRKKKRRRKSTRWRILLDKPRTTVDVSERNLILLNNDGTIKGWDHLKTPGEGLMETSDVAAFAELVD